MHENIESIGRRDADRELYRARQAQHRARKDRKTSAWAFQAPKAPKKGRSK